MTDNSFDKFIKDKLTDHSSPVPADMWRRIMPEKDDRRGAMLWGKNAMLLILIFAGILGGWLIWNEVEKSNSSNTPVSANSEQKKSTANNHGNTLLKAENQGGKNIGNAGSLPTDNSTPFDNSADNDLNPVTNKSGTNNTEAPKEDFLASPEMTIKKPSIKLAEDPRKSRNAGNENKLENSSLIPNASSNEYSLTSFNNLTKSTLSFVAKEENNFRQLQVSPELLSHLANNHLACLVDCPGSGNSNRSNLFIEVFASGDYAKKSISKSNGVSESYYKSKDSSERFGGAFTAGFRISKTFGENMMLKTGLQYSQINEKFTYRSENERSLITVVTIRTIIRNPGDTVIIRDTSTVEQIGYRVKTTRNKYRSLDVPIILGYEWGNENLRASVNAGVIFNLYSWQQGEMLDTSYTPVSFTKPSSDKVFKQNIGVGLYAGFSVFKPIGDKAELFAEPYIRYNISNMTKEKSPFTQKFNVAGINLGVRYKLSGKGQRSYAK